MFLYAILIDYKIIVHNSQKNPENQSQTPRYDTSNLLEKSLKNLEEFFETVGNSKIKSEILK